MTPAEAAALRRKVAWRILPLVFLLYIVAYLDRANVGFAKLRMSEELSFSEFNYGLGLGLFFIGYLVLEIPGALLVERWSARKWFARILISWDLFHPDRLCPHARAVLRRALFAGRGGSRLFSRHHCLFYALVHRAGSGTGPLGLVMGVRSAWRWARPSRGCFSNWIGWGWRGGNGFSFWKQRPPSCSGSSPWLFDRSPARRALADPTGTSMAGEPFDGGSPGESGDRHNDSVGDPALANRVVAGVGDFATNTGGYAFSFWLPR